MPNAYGNWMSPKEAADTACCTPRVILGACHSGLLHHKRWNKRTFKIHRDDLMAWLRTLDYPQKSQPAQPIQVKQPA
jgi:hypothetical protein